MYGTETPAYVERELFESESDSIGYLVNTPGCTIIDVDPFDKSLHPFLTQRAKKITCESPLPRMTYSDGNVLHFNTSAEVRGARFMRCNFSAIFREEYQENEDIVYKGNTVQLADKAVIRDDFINVQCFDIYDRLKYENFHSFIQVKPDVERRCALNSASANSNERVNVILLGIDSVSRLAFHRQMPRTLRFLENEMGAFEMKGYNKVEDNTFVNLVPMLSGKFVDELPWDERDSRKPFDDYRFIWKDFEERGYRTLFAEDVGEAATFNYMRAGFRKQPTDYYHRPLSLAVEQSVVFQHSDKNCVGARTETEIMLAWLLEYAREFRDKSHLAVAWISRLSHDTPHLLHAVDRYYRDFFANLKKSGALENTAVVLLSDHGLRYGDILETYVGKLEERLPFCFVALPERLRRKYPRVVHNLQTNTRRLTTPFDIHETLLNLLHFDGNTRRHDVGERAMSLFNTIPEERTCENAGIAPHWCTCQVHTSVSVTAPAVVRGSELVITALNALLYPHVDKCVRLRLARVKDGMMSRVNDAALSLIKDERMENDIKDKKLKFGNRTVTMVDYLLTVQATPGGGLFEATVRHNEEADTFEVMGDISRINSYKGQSDCIELPSLQRYCFCNELWNARTAKLGERA
ncbi:PREDICTED: uncharacterized protein LOC106804739 isoform X3 [Priapulus caudatus]|uniref:Uncharacterized protein LOC106804739 isoform X3 n=1 Tax=Priapulus caudatus TaxID=37621 RepID=A0ABM1DNM7_PRICU|nr:PREDICTED: uncharacterized protein LOC106804739 isoform X3 [Priapulus caudatus]